MSANCQCGSNVDHGCQHFGCIECGATCCAGCAVSLESVLYCASCAGSLLESTAVRIGGPFDLH